MKLKRPTILYRKDERGVITDSRVFSPGEEIPEGFGEAGYERLQTARVVENKISESKLTPWDSATAKAEATQEAPEGLNSGTPLQARQQVGGEITEAEKEAQKLVDEAASVVPEESNEVSDGSPVQAKEAAGVKLTEAEENPGEEKSPRRSRRNS